MAGELGPAVLEAALQARAVVVGLLPCGPPCDPGDHLCCLIKLLLTVVRTALGEPPCQFCL
jgi:hypothetical protein